MPKVTERHVDSRRAQILAAAVRRFAVAGFRATTMRDICRESGLSTGAVYVYFRGKEEILAACTERVIASIRALTATAMGRNAPADFVAFVRDFVSLGDRLGTEATRRIEVDLWGEALRTPWIRDVHLDSIHEVLAAARTMVGDSRGSDAVARASGATAEDVARLCMAAIMGLKIQAVLEPEADLSGVPRVLGRMLESTLRRPTRGRAQAVSVGPACVRRPVRGVATRPSPRSVMPTARNSRSDRRTNSKKETR